MAQLPIWRRLKALREYQGRSQADVADRLEQLGVPNAGVGMVETGKRPIPLDQLFLWIDAYNPAVEDREGLITSALREWASDFIADFWLTAMKVAKKIRGIAQLYQESGVELPEGLVEDLQRLEGIGRGEVAGGPAGRGD